MAAGDNISIKVVFRAFDQRHEEIFPNDYTISQLSNYLRCICHTYIIIEMTPSSKKPTI